MGINDSKINISDVWKSLDSVQINIGDTWKNVTEGYINIGDSWKKIFPDDTIELPAGLIVFYNSTSIPSGWTRYSAADNKMIIGASSTRIANTSGEVTISGISGSGGTHGHSGTTNHPYSSYGTQGVTIPHRLDTNSGGAHTHSISSLSLKPDRNQVVLIRKTSTSISQLPANVIMPSIQSLSGFTNVYTNGNYLSCGSSITTLARAISYALGSGGYHEHSNSPSRYSKIDPCNYYSDPGCSSTLWVEWSGASGTHSSIGTLSGTLTENIKRVLLSCWTKAASAFDLTTSMIAMWEGTTAPAGWKLCNGTNGTPDLRDCFIKPTTSGSENLTPTGNNTASTNLLVDHNDSHYHVVSNYGWNNVRSSYSYSNYYTTNHSHSFIVSNQALIPAYYALSFIMKA